MANPNNASITVSMPRELLRAFRAAVLAQRGPMPAYRNGDLGAAHVLREFIAQFVRDHELDATTTHDERAEAPTP